MSKYDEDIQKFSDEEKTLRSSSTDFIENSKTKESMHDCIICKRYSNSDIKGVFVHIVKSHKDILRLIKTSR